MHVPNPRGFVVPMRSISINARPVPSFANISYHLGPRPGHRLLSDRTQCRILHDAAIMISAPVGWASRSVRRVEALRYRTVRRQSTHELFYFTDDHHDINIQG
ncbi:hypothetical protein PILCRDRAFT_813289 [Piloderma croceum F 1598]|uniref:Uncharacterized protein n=1 Tax=Piloderma croceum (strain F 1598) TaxID=765440 RepID=A0A0C3FYR5_PILCF|nr:hypothetical protein PILCRDRAFT_813289 [Piloderma croceum F 1598]